MGTVRYVARSRREVLDEWVIRTESYVPKPYPGPMALLVARENPAAEQSVRDWSALVPQLRVSLVSGDHHGCIVEHIDETARAAAAALA